MKNAKFLLLSSALFLAGHARAQLNLPVSAISTTLPNISVLELRLFDGNANSGWDTGRPTPFSINNAAIPGTSNDVPNSLVWFCLDPLQVMYTNGSLPNGSVLNYASTNPAAFNKWDNDAPGLTAVRIQDLADLFRAYMPSTLAGNQTLIGALQLAVWEIVNEFGGNSPSYSLTSGAFRARTDGNSQTADNNVINLAQSFLSSLNTVGIQNLGNISYLDYLIDGTYTNNNCDVVTVQDLLGWTPDATPIPEPSTYGLAAIGILLPMALRRMRTRKSNSSPTQA